MELELARRALAAGRDAAAREGLALSFAVVDAAGHLVALERMDGADWITPEIAVGKAWTAAAYRAPSAAQGEKMRELVAFSAAITATTGGRYTPQVGGLPVMAGGDVVGAMGASGASGEQDEAAVRAALEEIGAAPD